MNDRLIQLLSELRMSGMANCIEKVLAEAEQKGLATEDVLLNLLDAEHESRRIRSLGNRIHAARLPWEWTLDTFPFDQQPGVNRVQIMNLAKLSFIERHENIVLIGKTGRGKSGIAMGLVREALLNGYRGRFYNAQEMLGELYASLADHRTSRLLKKLAGYDVLAIDELGYLNLNPEQVNMFFKLIDMRYGKKPTIVTTNLPFNKWYDVFKQKELVDALLDRFKHYCTVIDINGPSLRTEQTKQQKSPKGKRAVRKASK